METLSEKVKSLPDSPGVYLMKDAEGTIIYVGKAISLKKRVGSYFSRGSTTSKQEILVSKIQDIDHVLTASEAEALILEAGLIKEHHPKYNIAIKDDKAYPLLKLTINERYPRLRIARRKKNDGARYFGPYTSGKLLRQALNFMRRIFPLRTCNVMPRALCLNYHLKQCLGPCAGRIDGAGYAEVVRDLLLFLEGKKADLIARLSAEMAAAAAGRDFEKALELRDRIESLSSVPITRKRYRIVDQVEELRSVLRLKQSPARIEGYDISHISGSEPVGSMVCFRQGNPFKKEYRRFKIKTIEGIDDYAMIREVLRRRFSGTLKDRLELPQLILIDGGLGHLQSARQELEAAGVPVPVISIAKRFEHIYVEWQDEPLALARDSRALHLLMRVRDEAHRFALAYHRNLRKKNMLLSELDQIPGIGEKRRQILQRLLQAHPDTRRLTAQQIINSGGIDEKTAKNIIEHWNKY